MTDQRIVYDPAVTDNAGYVVLGTHPHKPLEPADRETLLYLVFYLIYTEPGRVLLKANPPPPDGDSTATEQSVVDGIGAAFPRLKGWAMLSTIAKAHVAGFRYATRAKKGESPDTQPMKDLEVAYKAELTKVIEAGELTALRHEFSMNW